MDGAGTQLFPKPLCLADGGCTSLQDDGKDSGGCSIPINKKHLGEVENPQESLENPFPHGLQTISHRPMAPLGPGRMQPQRSISTIPCPRGKAVKILLVLATSGKSEGGGEAVSQPMGQRKS